MHHKLSHLTNEQVNDLMRRYYDKNGDSISQLIKEYKIDVSLNQLYTLFPKKVFEEKCEYCDVNLEANYVSRTVAGYSFWEKDKFWEDEKKCPKCGHKHSQLRCNCSKCRQQEEEERRRRQQQEENLKDIQRAKIKYVYGTRVNSPLNIDQLDFVDRVYLGAVMRGFLAEDLSYIEPINPNILAPTEKMAVEIVETLINKKILVVSCNSDINAFCQNEDFPYSYYIFKVKYNLNIEISDNEDDFISKIMYPEVLKEEDREEAYKLWKKIAIEECIEYLLYEMGKVRFDFSPGEKTNTTFEELLKYFSVSQVYNIIRKKISDAARLYQEGNMSRKHAANTVISGCLSYGERAIMNNWDLWRYFRQKDLPQTIISEHLFNRVIGIGEMGFNMPPTMP